MNNLAERPNYLDYAKVIAIFCVLLGHYVYFCDIPFQSEAAIWKITHFVTLFHMPFFFFVSGMLYSNKSNSFKDYAIKQFKLLLLPYLLYSVIIGSIYYLSLYILYDDLSYVNVLKFIIGIITGGDFYGKGTIYPVGPIWFLYVLFFIKTIMALVENCKHKFVINVIILSLAVVSIYINRNIIPFRIDAIAVGYLFFWVGIRLKIYCIRLLSNVKYTVICVICSFLCLFLLDKFYLDDSIRQGLSINANFYGSVPVVFIISGLVGTLWLLSISSLLPNIFPHFVLRASNGMIVTLGFHKIIFLIFAPLFSVIHNVFFMITSSFIVLFICYGLIVLFEWKMPIMLGYRQ